MTERDLENKVVETFSRFNDINVVLEPSPSIYPWLSKNAKGKLRPDVVIEYGNLPFAIIEIKKDIKKSIGEVICNQFRIYKKKIPLACYIAMIDDSFYYYSDKDNNLQPQSFEDVLEKLINAIEKNEEDASELVPFLTKAIRTKFHCEHKKYLLSCIKDNNLKKHGRYLYLTPEEETQFMTNHLWGDKQIPQLCRYTSACGFCISMANETFRINSVLKMNDALETKALDHYPLLKDERKTLQDRLYQGFVLCFSDIKRKDKLLNWYMYGDKTKGVCFTIRATHTYEDNPLKDCFIFAPVMYVSKNHKRLEHGNQLLDFLNKLIKIKIPYKDEDYFFKLRLWHIWKYFFKYDYYDEEMETRLVYITKVEENYDRDNDGNKHPDHITKPINDMPLEIHECLTGCNCDSDKVEIIKNNLANRQIKVKPSDIEGYRLESNNDKCLRNLKD